MPRIRRKSAVVFVSFILFASFGSLHLALRIKLLRASNPVGPPRARIAEPDAGPHHRRMRRYAAFLRGVSPMNAKMPELKKAFEAAGFEDVKTVISSGNVVFTTRAASNASLQKKAEAAMEKQLAHAFLTIVRPVEELRVLLASDPYEPFGLPSNAKRIVTFLRETPAATLTLPIEMSGATIHSMKGTEIFSSYLPTSEGPVFMTLIEKTFGKAVTTRTWDTVKKVAR